jgi:hypothetical protein
LALLLLLHGLLVLMLNYLLFVLVLNRLLLALDVVLVLLIGLLVHLVLQTATLRVDVGRHKRELLLGLL